MVVVTVSGRGTFMSGKNKCVRRSSIRAPVNVTRSRTRVCWRSHARRQDYRVCEVAAMLGIQMETLISQLKKTSRQNCSFPSQFSPPMVRSQQQRQFETSSWRFCHIHLAVPTSHHAINIPLFHVKALRGRGFGSVKKWKERCIHGFSNSLTFFPDGIRKLVVGYKRCVTLQEDCVEK